MITIFESHQPFSIPAFGIYKKFSFIFPYDFKSYYQFTIAYWPWRYKAMEHVAVSDDIVCFPRGLASDGYKFYSSWMIPFSTIYSRISWSIFFSIFSSLLLHVHRSPSLPCMGWALKWLRFVFLLQIGKSKQTNYSYHIHSMISSLYIPPTSAPTFSRTPGFPVAACYHLLQ